MSRLYDRLLAEKTISDEVISEFKSAIVISGDNVCHYFFTGTDQEMWNIERDFPNIAPPFENFFIETKLPRQIISNKYGIVPIESYFPLNGWGLWFTAFPSNNAEVKWQVVCQLYFDQKYKHTAGPILIWTLNIMADGKIRKIEENKYDFQTLLIPTPKNSKEPFMQKIFNAEMSLRLAFCESMRTLLDVGLLTISFLHCKNVVLNQTNPSEKLQKKSIKKRGFPLVHYHVLDIEPMKQILRTEGNIENVGLKKALHICRGHFKDYTQGNGLFGRIKGLYWWDMFLRGDKSEGMVLKDYNIKL